MERAIKYVRDNGIKYTKERIEYCKGARLVGVEIDLKQIVAAFELVEKYGGINAINELIGWEMEHHANGKDRNKDMPNKKVIDRLKQAIELVEKCQ